MNRKLVSALTVLVGLISMTATPNVGVAAAAPTNSMAVCGAAGRGQAHCDAALLVSERTHTPVHPTVHTVAPGSRVAHTSAAAVSQEPAPDSPQWLQQAYDLTALSASRGSGDTVAIVDADNDPGAASDLATFRATYGLPACTQASGCLRIVNEQGQPSPLPASSNGWAVEETLDLQAVSSVCPNCNILLVEASSSNSNDLQTAMETAAGLGADQISDSWSITATTAPYLPDLLTATVAGAALPPVFAASGDSGADPLGTAEYPAALPTVTAVGGTTLDETSTASNPRGFTESAWSGSGSGCALGELSLTYQVSTGCPGRAYADVSADGDPSTGLNVYEAADGGWMVAGGTSLATPVVAAFDALTGVDAGSPQWAYTDSPALNDPTGGSNGACAGLAALLCAAGVGYDGPTGAGSISGAIVPGAPGVAGPALQSGGAPTDVESVTSSAAALTQGLYTNDEPTTYEWQYGTSTHYGSATPPASLAPSSAAVSVTAALTGLLPKTGYHYRLLVTNASGSVYGPDMTFQTADSSAQAGTYAEGSTPNLHSRRPSKSRVTAKHREAAALAAKRAKASEAKAAKRAKAAKAATV